MKGYVHRLRIALAAIVALAACESSIVIPEGGAVSTIEIGPQPVAVSINGTAQLQATLRNASGGVVQPDGSVFWASENSAIASVSTGGMVTGKLSGTTRVAASYQGVSSLVNVVVVSGAVTSVTIDPPAVDLRVGRTAQLTATPRDELGDPVAGRTVAWSSQNGSVATVNASGLVTAVGQGSTTVTATVDGRSGTADVVVTVAPVATVTIAPQSATLAPGETRQLVPTARDADGSILSGRAVEWTTSNASAATVSQTGLVSALAAGEATITATIEDVSATAAISVAVVEVDTVVVSPPSAVMTVGQTAQFTATPLDASGTPLPQPVVWATSHLELITVDDNGLATAHQEGEAILTASAGGKTTAVPVSISVVPVASVTIDPTSATRQVGQTQQFTVRTVGPSGEELTGRAVEWSIGDARIASFANATAEPGLVLAADSGTTLITATSGGVSASATLTVILVPVASVEINPPSPNTIPLGGTLEFTATPRDSVGNPLTGRAVAWSSSNSSVVDVDSNGLATGASIGVASVFAVIEDIGAPANIVTVTDVPIATVEISPPPPSIPEGGHHQFAAIAKDSNGDELDGRNFTWSTSHPLIASVSNTGLVVGVAAGSAWIKVSSEGKADSVQVEISTVPVASVEMNPASAALFVDSIRPFEAIPRDGGGLPLVRPIEWESSDSLIATVSATGLVTAKAPGEVTITATAGEVPGEATVSVSLVPVDSISIENAPATINVDQSLPFSAKAFANDVERPGHQIVWSSPDATVSIIGNVVTVFRLARQPSARPAVSPTNPLTRWWLKLSKWRNPSPCRTGGRGR